MRSGRDSSQLFLASAEENAPSRVAGELLLWGNDDPFAAYIYIYLQRGPPGFDQPHHWHIILLEAFAGFGASELLEKVVAPVCEAWARGRWLWRAGGIPQVDSPSFFLPICACLHPVSNNSRWLKSFPVTALD